MRIIQVLGSLLLGDAIGYHTIAIKKILIDAGYATEIYAEHIDKQFPERTAAPLPRRFCPKADDILIYHLSFGGGLNLRLRDWKCRKILMYHNITPPQFFEPYDEKSAASAKEGLEQASQLREHVERCVVMSGFNKRDLTAMGYPADRIWVMPSYFIPFENYEKVPDVDLLNQYSDGRINLLFVGRLAPNKRQEDVIRVFAYYKKYINANSRLFLVGAEAFPDYVEALRAYAAAIGVSDVIFPGHISFAQIIAIYRIASVFLCMSEHEGFCVPLVEAMYFDLPVIAYDAAAIPETLGGSGILLDSKDPGLWAAWIQRIVGSPELRGQILEGQRNRLKQFHQQTAAAGFLNYLRQII